MQNARLVCAIRLPSWICYPLPILYISGGGWYYRHTGMAMTSQPVVVVRGTTRIAAPVWPLGIHLPPSSSWQRLIAISFFLNMKRDLEKIAWPTLALVAGAIRQLAWLAAPSMDSWMWNHFSTWRKKTSHVAMRLVCSKRKGDNYDIRVLMF